MKLVPPLVFAVLVLLVGRALAETSVLDEIPLGDAVPLPPEPGWAASVLGPIGLGVFLVFLLLINKAMVPFRPSRESLLLYDYPTGVKRGLAVAIVLFGVAFLLGAFEILYKVRLHGSSAEYFGQMPFGKMLAFTHAHLFGFTTSFLVIGIPFSMQFNHLWTYQWIFPIGLAACFTDIVSWWGIKYVSPSFVWVSIVCGVVFSASYLYMLIGLLRVLLFPQVVWPSDRDWRERGAGRRDPA